MHHLGPGHAEFGFAQPVRRIALHQRVGRQHLQVFLVDEGELIRVHRVLAETKAERIQHAILRAVALLYSGDFQRQQFFNVERHDEALTIAGGQPHTSFAISTIILSFAHCSSSARILPSSVEAKPHCGDRQSCTSATNFAACSMRRLSSSLDSSRPLFEVTRPSTTVLPFGTKRSGSKPPARSLSYSRK